MSCLDCLRVVVTYSYMYCMFVKRMLFYDDWNAIVHLTGTAVGLTPLPVTPLPKESTSATSTQNSFTMATGQRRCSSNVDKLAAQEQGSADTDELAGKVVFKLDDDDPSGDNVDEDHPEATEHPGPLVTHPRLQRLHSSDSTFPASPSPTNSQAAEPDSGIFTSPDSSRTVLRWESFSVLAIGHS